MLINNYIHKRTTSITDSPNSSVESKENQENSTETRSTPTITENIQSNGSLDLNNTNKINSNNTNSNNKFSNSNNYQMSAMHHEKRNSTISLSSVSYGGSDRCARCLKAVYAAEKVVAAGKVKNKINFK